MTDQLGTFLVIVGAVALCYAAAAAIEAAWESWSRRRRGRS